jgi:lysozyme family protein
MRLDEAKAIYRAHYWNAVCGDALPAGVDYCVFDYAVNSGVARAAKVLQRVLGAPATGRLDTATLQLARSTDAKRLIAAICDERLRFLRSLKTWGVFGVGWSRRVQAVRAAALAMTGHAAAGAPGSEVPKTPGKAVVPVNAGAQKGTAAAIVVLGGAAAALSGEATTAVIALAFTVAAAAGAWAFWHWRQRQAQGAPPPIRKPSR